MELIVLLILGTIVGVIAAWKVLADKMADVAKIKGYGKEVHAWEWCFFLGIFGYIYILSLPDKGIRKQNQQIIELLEKQNENIGEKVEDKLPSI